LREANLNSIYRKHPGLVSGVFLFLAAGRIFALEAALDFIQKGESAEVSVFVSGVDEKELGAYIRGGNRVRVQYTLRIYRDGGRSQFLGDSMFFEANPVQEGRWDVFSSSWEIRGADGGRVFYRDWETFYRKLFELRAFPVPNFSGGAYMLVRARFQKTVFRPPLSILQTVYDKQEYQSPWRRFEIP
jgi:hypothetical protein